MSDTIKTIQAPVEKEMADFNAVFRSSLVSSEDLLGDVMNHVTQRGGKRLRPLLVLLLCKAFVKNGMAKEGRLWEIAMHGACALELLHTASLVHDDVVDESGERRGQASVNSAYNNKVAVLSGDYILSAALSQASLTDNCNVVQALAKLGQTLSEGEIHQLSNISNSVFSEEIYYNIISKKTASLFETCCLVASIACGLDEEEQQRVFEFGHNIGMMFQIRDDIFDYYDSKEVGKPTGNDMAEGKLTLPVLYVLNNGASEEIIAIAQRVKQLTATKNDIEKLVAYTIDNGGIDYARKVMDTFFNNALLYIEKTVNDAQLNQSLTAYIEYVIGRNY